MCRSANEPGGPKRCSGDTRAALERATYSVELLERTEEQLVLELEQLNREADTDFVKTAPIGDAS